MNSFERFIVFKENIDFSCRLILKITVSILQQKSVPPRILSTYMTFAARSAAFSPRSGQNA